MTRTLPLVRQSLFSLSNFIFGYTTGISLIKKPILSLGFSLLSFLVFYLADDTQHSLERLQPPE
jgi:hypothetical protein